MVSAKELWYTFPMDTQMPKPNNTDKITSAETTETPPTPPQETKQSILSKLKEIKLTKPLKIGFIFAGIVVIGAGTLYFLKPQAPKPPPDTPPQAPTTDQNYTITDDLKIDLAQVTNDTEITFSPEQETLLKKLGFFVKPAYHSEFFSVYESNRYEYIPNFVTTDSILHNYHLMFDHLLKQLEEEKLSVELKKLNEAMLSTAISQYNEAKGTEWENAAKRNVGFFAVASKLFDSSIAIPEYVKGEVEQELDLIEQHGEITASPVMNIGLTEDIMIETPAGPQPLQALKEDYTQYIPRGHYDKTDLLKTYFKSMMWYGRLTFRFKNPDEVKSAILITQALDSAENETTWNNIYEPVNFFVGKADDIGYPQFKEEVKKVHGENPTVEQIIAVSYTHLTLPTN